MTPRIGPVCWSLLFGLATSCEPGAGTPAVDDGTSARGRPGHTTARFVDVTDRSGVDFVNVSGSTDKNYILELNGGGVALIDYDRDGRLDIFLVNGSRLRPPHGAGPGSPPPTDALYRNLGGLRFENVTAKAGLVESEWGCGVAAGDYDGDGDPDLYVANYGPDRAVVQQRGWDLLRCDGRERHGRLPMGLERRVRRFRSRWPSRSVRRQLPRLRSVQGEAAWTGLPVSVPRRPDRVRAERAAAGSVQPLPGPW